MGIAFLALVSPPGWAMASEEMQELDPPVLGRATVSYDGSGAGWSTAGSAVALVARLRLEKPMTDDLSLWAGPQFRFVLEAVDDETIQGLELAAGVRFFPGGSAPEGFNLGAYTSMGRGTFGHPKDDLASLGSSEEGTGTTWSAGGIIGWDWISKGGICFGLRLDLALGTVSLRDDKVGAMIGVGYSLGGVVKRSLPSAA